MPERKEGVVPRLRFPEFRNTGPWEEKRLGEICDVLQGYGFPEKFQGKKNGKYPFCKVSDITYAVNKTGGAIARAENYVDDEDIEALRARLVPIGATVFAKIGEALRLNKRALVSVECLIDNNVVGLRGRDNQTKDRFVFYLSQKIDLNEYCGGAVPAVNKSTLESIKLFVPEIEEQQKIADCLSSLDEVIELEAQKLEALKAHKKGLMQQLFPRKGETTPRLRFPEFRNAGEWEVKKIVDIFRVTRGEVLSMKLVSESYSTETPYPVYSSQTKNNGLSGYYSDYLYEDAITWTTDGANAGDVKYRKGKFYCTNVCGVLISEDGYANSFVAELLNTVTKKHVSYVGNPKLMNGVMAQIQIPFPQIKEQQKIADCLSSLDEVIELEAQKLEALKTHKKGLMQQLFPQEVD